MGRSRERVPERSLAAACAHADIVIADRWLPRSCQPRWLKADRNMLHRTGGLAIDLANARIQSVGAAQGEHGWWRAKAKRMMQPDRSGTGKPGERHSAQ